MKTIVNIPAHPEIHFNNLLDLKTINEYTDYRYVFGGFVCEFLYEKGNDVSYTY